MQKILMAFLMLQTRLLAPREDEKGQGTLEYVGMIIVAAILVLAVINVANGGDLANAFQQRIQDVINN